MELMFKSNRKLQISAAALILAMGTALPAFALSGNVLVNPGFEADSIPNWGNNTTVSTQGKPTGWTFGNGQSPNIVKMDGPGGQATWYGSSGPESDANPLTGVGVTQHYLDITQGSNHFYQSFTPKCTGKVVFGGSFSTRANTRANARVSILKANGTVVGQTNQISMPSGNSKTDPWKKVSFTANIVAGQNYRFEVRMDNYANFDEGFVQYETKCDAYPPDVVVGTGSSVGSGNIGSGNAGNGSFGGGVIHDAGVAINTDIFTIPRPASPKLPACCSPWNENVLQQSLKYLGSGGMIDPYTLRYSPAASVNQQMEAYINYLHALDPGVTSISINFRLFDKGQNPNSPGLGTQLGSPHFLTWTAGDSSAPSNGGGNFFQMASQSMKINNWYRVHSGVYLNNGKTAFGKDCANHEMLMNIQVQNSGQKSSGGSPSVVLKTMKKGRIQSKALKTSVKKGASRPMKMRNIRERVRKGN